MIRIFPLTLATLFIVGCSSGGPAGNSSSSFDKGFVDSFRPKFVDQCQAGAKKTSGTNKDFSAICGCIADKLIATKSVSELMGSPSPEEVKRYTEECAREHPLS